MNRKDTAIVAVILAAALAAGLGTVGWLLHQEQRQQDLQFEKAQAAWQAAGSAAAGAESSEASGEEPSSGEDTTSEAASGTAGTEDTGSGAESEESAGMAAGETGSAGGGNTAAGQLPDLGTPPALAAGETGSAGGGNIAAGQLPDLGTPPALAAGSELTLEELVEWMTTESSGALEAETLATAEKALADGVGTADDALRREFAASQWESNHQARLNLLEQQAVTLAMTWLQCQESLSLQEENLAWYQGMKEEIEAKLETLSKEVSSISESSSDAASATASETETSETASSETDSTEAAEAAARLEAEKACAEADLQQVEEAIAEAELAVKSAQADLDKAQTALNEAVGLSAGDTLTISGELTPDSLPELSREDAIAQGLSARNEIKGALYAIQQAEEELTTLRYQAAPDSPEVQKQQAALEKAQAAYPAAQTSVEADVIDRLTRLEIAFEKIELTSSQLNSSAPAAYAFQESGGQVTSNLAQLRTDQAEQLALALQLASQTAQFNQEVVQFRHAVGAGTVTAET